MSETSHGIGLPGLLLVPERLIRLARICDSIRRHLEQHPEHTKSVLEAVVGGIDGFVDHTRAYRDQHAERAILTMMGSSKPKSVPMSISTAYTRWPNGYNGGAPVEEKWWEQFIKVASEWPADMRWMEGVHGELVARWWHEHVEPHLAKPLT